MRRNELGGLHGAGESAARTGSDGGAAWCHGGAASCEALIRVEVMVEATYSCTRGLCRTGTQPSVAPYSCTVYAAYGRYCLSLVAW